jgi:hypothetical protein
MSEIKIVTALQRKAGLTSMDKAQFKTIRSGQIPGKYVFVTGSGSIYGLKPITANNGKKWGLTIVAGVLTGSEPATSHVNESFGLGDMDAQLVFTADQFLSINENQTYDLVINEKGRVGSVLPVQVATNSASATMSIPKEEELEFEL